MNKDHNLPRKQRNIASSLKIALHQDKLIRFLRGENVYPICLELDITTECNKQCDNCPSRLRPKIDRLSTRAVEQLFSLLQGQTTGLLLSGGEPTIAENFPAVLRLARQYNFIDVALVTNGSRLGEKLVIEALLSDASAVRISLYGWDRGPSVELQETLRLVTALREKVESTGSELEIGYSVLTSATMADQIQPIIQRLGDSGAHWVYFHPMCFGWEKGFLEQFDQNNILRSIKQAVANAPAGLDVLVYEDRYHDINLHFDEYYTAHFLMVVGADGFNYLGTELKYQHEYAIADFSVPLKSDFLWQPSRLEKITAANSKSFPSTAGRHRGILYADLIERLKVGREILTDLSSKATLEDLRFPSVL